MVGMGLKQKLIKIKYISRETYIWLTINNLNFFKGDFCMFLNPTQY